MEINMSIRNNLVAVGLVAAFTSGCAMLQDDGYRCYVVISNPNATGGVDYSTNNVSNDRKECWNDFDKATEQGKNPQLIAAYRNGDVFRVFRDLHGKIGTDYVGKNPFVNYSIQGPNLTPDR